MKLLKLFLLVTIVCFYSCSEKKEKEEKVITENEVKETTINDFKYWT